MQVLALRVRRTSSSQLTAVPAHDSTHRPLSSSFLGFPSRILIMNHKKELLRALWVAVLPFYSSVCAGSKD